MKGVKHILDRAMRSIDTLFGLIGPRTGACGDCRGSGLDDEKRWPCETCGGDRQLPADHPKAIKEEA